MSPTSPLTRSPRSCIPTLQPSQCSTIPTNPTPKDKYFAGQYEYEVSPTSSPPNSSRNYRSSMTSNDTIITERMVPVTKTVFLIRHAESDENRRLASLTKTFKGLTKLKLPNKEDVVASMELINVPAQIDSDVSPIGRSQIDALGAQIAKDGFVEKMGIQLVAHSPLKRARQTSEGMLGCVTPANDRDPDAKIKITVEDDCSAEGKKAESVGRIVELPVLSERTPMEWLPINHDAFTKRIAEFEKWLAEQPEDVIAIVGHSQYFKSMLGLPKKFKNCDVWSLQFDSTVVMSHASVKEEINTTERTEKKKKLKKKLNAALNASPLAFNDDDKDKDERKDESDTEKDGSDGDARETVTVSSSVFESESEIFEIDGVRVDDLELPRGWRDLKRHYTYDASMAL